MNERQRERLLDRIERPSRTIGEEIPEQLSVLGTTIDLKEFVFECNRLETIPEDEQDRIEEMKRDLRRERLARKHRIARDDISYEEGERIARSIHGIDRAVNALESIDSPGIDEELRQKRIEDAKELLALLDSA